MEHVGVGQKNVPVGVAYAIPTLSAIDSGEIKRAVDVRICVSEVEELTERKEFVALGILFGRVRTANEMGVQRRTWP